MGKPGLSIPGPESPSSLSTADVQRMHGALFLTDRTQRSAFWALLVLSAIISGAGVVATVIGAMIDAPLMTPILGAAYSSVLALRTQIISSILLVLGGAVVVVVIGLILGMLFPGPVVADTNSQVADRASPGLIDLVAALATGSVGAFALVRSDVSDTLPGVAIANWYRRCPSSVSHSSPGHSGKRSERRCCTARTSRRSSRRVQSSSSPTGPAPRRGHRMTRRCRQRAHLGRNRRTRRCRQRAAGHRHYHVFQQERLVGAAQPIVVEITVEQGVLHVTAAAPRPGPDVDSLRRVLDQAGLTDVAVKLSLVFGSTHQAATSPG